MSRALRAGEPGIKRLAKRLEQAVNALGACLIDRVQPGLRLAAYLLDALRGLVGGQIEPLGASVRPQP